MIKLANKLAQDKQNARKRKKRRNIMLGVGGTGLALGGAYLGRNKIKRGYENLAAMFRKNKPDVGVPQSVKNQVSDVDVPEELYDVYFPQSLNFPDGLDPDKARRYVDIDHPDNIKSEYFAYGRPVATKSGEEFNLYDHIDTSGKGYSLEEMAGREMINVGGQRITGLTKEQAERILYTGGGQERSPRIGMNVATSILKRDPNVKMQQMPTMYGTDAALGGISDSSYLNSFKSAI